MNDFPKDASPASASVYAARKAGVSAAPEAPTPYKAIVLADVV